MSRLDTTHPAGIGPTNNIGDCIHVIREAELGVDDSLRLQLLRIDLISGQYETKRPFRQTTHQFDCPHSHRCHDQSNEPAVTDQLQQCMAGLLDSRIPIGKSDHWYHPASV